jgi:hypothetical protein
MGDSLFGGGTGKVNSTTNNATSSNTNQSQSGTSNPSDFQLPYITEGLRRALGTYNNAPSFSPLAYQTMQPGQIGALNDLSNFAKDALPAARGLIGGGEGALYPSLNNAASAGSRVLGNASGDPTQANIDAAGRYANNPYTQGLITAAQTPIERQLKEVALPGLNASGAATGNLDSSRSAMAEAILRRSAGEDESNVASTILGNQYNNGLSLAENARTANQNALLQAMSGFGNLANTGANLIGAGNSMGLSNLGVEPVSTGQIGQQDANAANKTAYDNAMGASQFPWAQLGSFWDIAGHPLGQTSTSSGTGSSSGTNLGQTNGTQTQPGPGLLGGLLGLGTGIGSFFTPTGAFGLGPSLFSRIKSAF